MGVGMADLIDSFTFDLLTPHPLAVGFEGGKLYMPLSSGHLVGRVVHARQVQSEEGGDAPPSGGLDGAHIEVHPAFRGLVMFGPEVADYMCTPEMLEQLAGRHFIVLTDGEAVEVSDGAPIYLEHDTGADKFLLSAFATASGIVPHRIRATGPIDAACALPILKAAYATIVEDDLDGLAVVPDGGPSSDGLFSCVCHAPRVVRIDDALV